MHYLNKFTDPKDTKDIYTVSAGKLWTKFVSKETIKIQFALEVLHDFRILIDFHKMAQFNLFSSLVNDAFT